MKTKTKLISMFMLGVLLFTACAPTSGEATATSAASTEAAATASFVPSVTPPSTNTSTLTPTDTVTPGPKIETFTDYWGNSYTITYGELLADENSPDGRSNDSGLNHLEHDLIALYSREGNTWLLIGNFGNTSEWLKMGYGYQSGQAPEVPTWKATYRTCTVHGIGLDKVPMTPCNKFENTGAKLFLFPGVVLGKLIAKGNVPDTYAPNVPTLAP